MNIAKTCSWIFLLSLTLLSGCKSDDHPADLQQIIDRGTLRVGTLFGPNSYYVDANGPSGFEYELAKKYADHLGSVGGSGPKPMCHIWTVSVVCLSVHIAARGSSACGQTDTMVCVNHAYISAKYVWLLAGKETFTLSNSNPNYP